ncbi:hypothetical protein AYR62_06180 [Secundilactobacillus paracollinoides]|uniref:Uncharacterized protein n=1 Tax=Secundilactobacillus paracollinoides TaxID=240427 RepID=A0A1B2J151_9LACO|nr:hypothetical protein AYR61_12185 [Secundilactobacillus paracollinoides]ANZ63721.1 hypothetical protein AYR62_06180 [Secundilactobacillus paracollinoides]ANZ67980.1 hypothetical protein AYR63_13080 [Secundilactobacillus paracollinoides]
MTAKKGARLNLNGIQASALFVMSSSPIAFFEWCTKSVNRLGYILSDKFQSLFDGSNQSTYFCVILQLTLQVNNLILIVYYILKKGGISFALINEKFSSFTITDPTRLCPATRGF